jgi:ABC-type Mn2+/Zn2+ transport system permease subunit
LPGATALLLGLSLRGVMASSVLIALVATGAGIIVSRHWPFVPIGPIIVLAMFAQFLAAYGWGKVRKE